MKIDQAYDLWAGSYDAMPNRTRDLDAEATSEMLSWKQYPVVVEAGCGTGKNTGVFAAQAEQVIALDFSEGMLQVAREKVKAPNVTFLQADLSADWPVPGGTADLVSFNLVLEHIEDLRPVLARAAQCLKAGGELFISELHPYKQYIGGKANFTNGEAPVAVTCYTHHISDFWEAARLSNLELIDLREWMVQEEGGEAPRLVSLLFRKTGG